MQEPGSVELLAKLTDLLREHGDPILQGRMKLSLTATSLQYLHSCFETLQSGVEESGFQLSREHFVTYVPYLYDFLQKTKSLKLVQGFYFKSDLVNVSCFNSLQYLEIKKVPVSYIEGLQTLRSRLKTLCCSRSVIALDEVFVKCGADRLSTPFTWPCLEKIDLSYNSIGQLDDSIKLFPSLHSLNLSHNTIELSEDDENWQSLSEVQYLNLGFNHIDCIPRALLTGVEFKLAVLILRNNNLENLEGIQNLGHLEFLDVANNCIATFLELTPLAHLAQLISLCLEGNPVTFHPDYRVNTISCMSPLPRKKTIILDDKQLTTLEEVFIGNTVHPVSPLNYIPATPMGRPQNLSVGQVPKELLESSMEVSVGSMGQSPRKVKKKKKRPKRTRQISLSEADGGTSTDERPETPITLVEDGSQLEYEEDVERLKQLRRLGGEGWLPAVNRIMGVDTKPLSRPPQEEAEILDDIKSSVHAAEPTAPSSKESDIYSNDFVEHDSDWEEGIYSPASGSSIVTLSDGENADSNRNFPVTTIGDEEEEDHIFVSVDEEYIQEANISLKVICRLETNKLVSVSTEDRAVGETPVIVLRFDYLKRERQRRRYSAEDQDALKLMKLLETIVLRNELNRKAAEVQMQCLKCSARFIKNERETGCPDCSSTMVVEMMTSSPNEREVSQERLTPDLQQRSVNTADTDTSVIVPFSSTPKSTEKTTKKDEYASRDGTSATLKEESRAGTKKPTANGLQNPQSVFGVAANETIKPNERVEIKTYVVSNSGEFSVTENSGKFTVNTSSPRTSALSSSLKLADEMKTMPVSQPYASGPEKERGDKNLNINSNSRTLEDMSVRMRERRERWVYKPSTNVSHMAHLAPVNQEGLSSLSKSVPSNSSLTMNPRKKDLVKEHSREAINSTAPVKLPQTSPSPNIFVNLLTRLGGRVSGPNSEGSVSSSQSSRAGSSVTSRSQTPTIGRPTLAFHISEDKFTSLDHRLKLLFEVSLFTGGRSEAFHCLMKAPVVLYGSTKEMSAVIIVSNVMCYICRMKEIGSGTPAECLSRLASHPLEDLQFIDCGLGSQSFRLEFNDEDGYYVFHVRDQERCEKFLEYLVGAVEQRKAKTSSTPVCTNTKDPQTLAHIRSQVFGVREEQLSDKGERLHEQCLLFTDPPLIKDRKSLLVRSHPNCFVGKEFVDWLLRWKEVKTRQQAVDLGQSLLEEGFLEHASKEPTFEDKDQFYRFTEKLQPNSANGEESGRCAEIEESLPDLDLTIELFLMLSYSADESRPGELWNPVSAVVSKTHFALAEQNPQWPLPRRLPPPPSLKEPQFVCIARHKITDITSLEFYEDSPRYVGIGITDEDAPLESAETHWLLRAQTTSSLLSLVKLLKESWERQFGVDLPQTLHPMLELVTVLVTRLNRIGGESSRSSKACLVNIETAFTVSGAAEADPLVQRVQETHLEQHRKVLIPVDHSQHAEDAFKWYMVNIHHPHDDVLIVHCSEVHAPALPHQMATSDWKDYLDNHQKKIVQLEERYKKLLKEEPALASTDKATIFIEPGSPGRTICELAKREKATMIVMGSRGMGAIRRTILGSVSDYVIKHAHIPVTVIPKEKHHH